MAMTVRDLIEILEAEDPMSEIRLAIQPRYPLEYSVGEVTRLSHPDEKDGERLPPLIYLTEGRHIGYAPEGAFGEDPGFILS